MKYYSSRNKNLRITSMDAILKGLSDDGGLFIPEIIPKLPSLDKLRNLSYIDLAGLILSMYFDDYSQEEISQAVQAAYGERFEEEVVALRQDGNLNFLELYHGPTLAFKDMALTVLPHLMRTALKNKGVEEEVLILTATSGDTGKAALEGFKDIDGIRVIVFYPEDGVSNMQKLQMISQKGNNTYVFGVKGDFDDAQAGVKEIFSDMAYKEYLQEKGYILSSANSINIGRLIPQIVYYIYAYIELLNKNRIEEGQEINFVVPTGNFGNILAGFYAKKMGLPIGKLICASNENKVLSDFFQSGTYDRRRELIPSSSPSMDILVSSNLERYIFEVLGKDEYLTERLMNELKDEGVFSWENFKGGEIYGNYASEEEVAKTIKEVFESSAYLIDPHTAVAYSVYKRYREEENDDRPAVIVSTASPYKFPEIILESLGEKLPEDPFDGIRKLSKLWKKEVPGKIRELEDSPVLHKNTIDRGEMKDAIKNLIEVDK